MHSRRVVGGRGVRLGVVLLLGLVLLLGGQVLTGHLDGVVLGGPGPAGIRTDAPPCSGWGYDVVEDCINTSLPPSPSLRRRFVRPVDTGSQSASVVDASLTKPFSGRSHTGAFAQTFALPNHRTSVDGRLTTVGGPNLARFSPENLAPGFQTFQDPGRRLLSHYRLLVHEIRSDPRPGRSRIPQHVINQGEFNAGLFWEMCNGTSPDGEGQMRRCRARRTPGEQPMEGECYDATMIWANSAKTDAESWWELRSIDLTVFIPREKSVPTSAQPHWADGYIYYYPRSEVAGLTELPPLSEYGLPSQYGSVVSHQGLVQAANAACTGASQPRWCTYLDEQRTLVSEDFRFYTSPDTYHYWNGRHGQPFGAETFHALLEPATTADGRVLFIHDFAQGILYSYNEVGACDARGFRDFKPLSQAHLDPDVKDTYGFARYPVRDTNGRTLAPGATVIGAYPWVDRKGNNLMFPVADGQDGFVGRWVANPGEAGWAPDGQEVQPHQVNTHNSTGVVVVGAWTRGKMIVLDNGLNATDWSFGPYTDGFRDHRFLLPLYRGRGGSAEEVLVRPAGVSLLNSLENSLNQYDVMNPISPFEVVWTASSTQARNAEVVFDEYLRRGMEVVAHMNAPMTSYPTGEPRFPYFLTYDNGFVPTAQKEQFVFRGTPRLQNASTGASPATLELRGGAWIPPVAEGGVLGRGVYLDGINDHILAEGLPGGLRHFYVGLWIDQRWPSSWTSRTLYRFGDGTQVTLRQGEVRIVAPDGGAAWAELSPKVTGHKRYFHLGLAFSFDGRDTTVHVWQDGTYVANDRLAGRVQFAPAQPSGPVRVDCTNRPTGWHCAGNNLGAALCYNGRTITTSDCTYSHMVCSQDSIAAGGPPCVPSTDGRLVIGNFSEKGEPPIRAYVDELRLIDLQSGEATSRVFAEFACNMALGSLAPPGLVGSRCEQIPFRYDEPQDAEGVGTGLDFAVEAYTQRNCGNTVHRNKYGRPCGHNHAYGLDDRQLVAFEPRPDFSDLTFCKTCHRSNLDPIPGLRIDEPLERRDWILTRDDPRRQPTSFFRNMPGTAPRMGGIYLDPFGDTWDNDVLDDVIYGDDPTEEPTRAGPYN